MSRKIQIRDLERHVTEFEHSFPGTTLHISRLYKDLLAFQARMERRFDQVLGKRGRFDRMDGKFDRIERELQGLRADIPKIVRRALRDAQRDNSRKRP